MKKIMIGILGLVLMLIFAGCGADEKMKTDQVVFSATVLEVNENSLLVEPAQDSEEYKSSDQIEVGLAAMSEELAAEIRDTIEVDDIVMVVYDGGIEESYPAQISAQNILLELDASEPLMEYTENEDGTFSTEDATYKYKIELTGTLPNASGKSKFTVLTNDRDVTFEEVAKSTYSSDSADFLDYNETVIVNIE